MQSLDLQRKIRALDQIDKRERQSLEQSLRAEQRIAARGGKGRMPALNLDRKPKGRPAAVAKAKNRYTSPFAQELANAAQQRRQQREKIDLSQEFERAAGEGKSGDQGRGSSDGRKPASPSRRNRPRSRKRDKDRDR